MEPDQNEANYHVELYGIASPSIVAEGAQPTRGSASMGQPAAQLRTPHPREVRI